MKSKEEILHSYFPQYKKQIKGDADFLLDQRILKAMEEYASQFKSQPIPSVTDEEIKIADDGRCLCTCATVCPLGKVGSMARCSKEELENSGIKTAQSRTPSQPKQ